MNRRRPRRRQGVLKILGQSVAAGSRSHLELPAGRLPSGTWMGLPVEVVRGKYRGPSVWLSGAIHGDEIVGVEIIRQVMESLDADEMWGTVIAAPVINVFGFIAESRYLPDRRDLNRSFPGSKGGSQAARLAQLFMTEVVSRCDYGIDFHAGSDDRTNLPQIRCNLKDPETHRLAEAFAAPIMIHGKTIRGTLRSAATKQGKRVLLFEGGEPRRFSESALAAGVPGTLRVLQALRMLADAPRADAPPATSVKTQWVRAPRGGIFRIAVAPGAMVGAREPLGSITDPFGSKATLVRARQPGMVIGHTVNPLVHRGDALVHVGLLERRG